MDRYMNRELDQLFNVFYLWSEDDLQVSGFVQAYSDDRWGTSYCI